MIMYNVYVELPGEDLEFIGMNEADLGKMLDELQPGITPERYPVMYPSKVGECWDGNIDHCTRIEIQRTI